MTNKILLVEDDRLDQKAFERFIKQEDLAYTYVLAGSVTDAIDAMQSEAFDIVLIDYMLGDGTGFDVLQAVPSDVPSIFITGIGSEEIAVDALHKGALDYLIKDRERTYLKLLPVVIDRAIRTKADEKTRLTLSQAVKSSADSIIITDLDGTITYVNEAFCDLYHYQQEHIIGKNRACLLPLDTQVNDWHHGEAYESEHLRQDNTQFSASVTQSKITNVTGKMFAHVIIVRDVTEQKRLIENLDSFAHTVAHDLKNPASQILGYANLLADAFDEFEKDELIDYLRTVERQSSKMIRIINALLLLASTTRQTEIPYEELNMRRIVRDVMQRLGDMIATNNAQISIQSEFPVTVGYAPWVEEVWVNYLSNAIKYGGKPAHIDIGADLIDDRFVRFWVRDNGQGLTTEDQSQLFQSFKRVTQAKIEGHGLGLSIVRQIVERLGGRVDVKSTVGRGSEFGFTLPVSLKTSATQ